MAREGLVRKRFLVVADGRNAAAEFGRYEKHTITIRHLLTHRAGLAITPRDSMNLELLGNSEKILALLYAETPAWTPGRYMGYHALPSGFLFDALIQTVTGKTIDRVLVQDRCGIRFGANSL